MFYQLGNNFPALLLRKTIILDMFNVLDFVFQIFLISRSIEIQME